LSFFLPEKALFQAAFSIFNNIREPLWNDFRSGFCAFQGLFSLSLKIKLSDLWGY